MTFDIVLWLAQDGITNGAIYALLALALLLVFSVTRVIFVPQGEFISYAALSLALLQAGQVPGVVYVLVGGGLVAAALDIAKALRNRSFSRLPLAIAAYVIFPCAMAALAWWAAPLKLDLVWQVL
ncbi:MAG TPA: branched-chain amino acid ABC transporter permease, partial [Burkholderiales bacterium]